MMKAKPFVKWVGGKTQLLSSIEKVFPTDIEQKNITYVEPFVGGGAVLFWVLQKYPNIKKAIINDINPDLITAYKTIKESPYELINKLQIIQNEYIPLNDDERKGYYLNKRNLFNSKSLNYIENTALFIFLNRTCFNGLYRVNKSGAFNVPFGKYSNPKICDEQTILADSERLQKVEILTGDFEKTLNHISGKSLFYFDPPYKPLSNTSSFNSYSKEDFNDREQERLAEFCKRINSLGHNFILSNSDVKSKNPNDNFFDNLYGQFNIHKVYATRMVNSNPEKRGKLTELMISNIKNNDYIPALRLNKEDLFIRNYDKPFWILKDKVEINKIKINNNLFAFNNQIIDTTVNQIVSGFNLTFWIPITVNKDFYLLDGQHRLEAAKRMNLKYIDVVIQDTELLEANKTTKQYKTKKFIL